MGKLKGYISLLRNVNIKAFFYLNYFCKNVIRMDNSKIIPYKHSLIDIEKDSKIYIAGGDIELGCDLMRGSKAETRVRLRENAVWKSEGGCKISYGVTLEILNGAVLNTQYFTMNSYSTVVAAKEIAFGNDVMIGRNVVIYDSDFHSMIDEHGKPLNLPQPVIIGDHVWVGTNAMILKGTTINKGSVIGAKAIVCGEVKENTILTQRREMVTKENYGSWRREQFCKEVHGDT